MKKIIDKIFKLFNYVPLKEIKIQPKWGKPGKLKMELRLDYYLATNKFAVPIVLDKDNYLVDGYTSYLIAKLDDYKRVKVLYRD